MGRILCALFLLLVTSFVAAAQSPDQNDQNNAEDTPVLTAIHQALGAHNYQNGAIQTLQDLSTRIVDTVPEWSSRIRITLQKEASAIYYAILLPVLIAEITFIGVRIMMRASIAEQFLRLTTMTFILITVSYFLRGTFSMNKSVDENMSAKSTNVFVTASRALADAGRVIGKNIIVNNLSASSSKNPALTKLGSAGGDDRSLEPLYYWAAWIGTPPDPTKEQPRTIDPANEYKYSVPSLLARIWNDPTASESLPQFVIKEKDKGGWRLPLINEETIGRILQNAIYMFMPFQVITTVFAIAQWQLGGYIAVVFGYIAILVASVIVLDVVVALAMTLLPLIYFKSFEGLWSQVLTVITGLSLIPCFYYILSAIGFVFVDQMFDQLFPLVTVENASDAVSFAAVLNSCYATAVVQALACVNSLLVGAAGLVPELGKIFYTMIFLGRLLFGSMIVTVLVGAGVSFGALAPAISMRWRQGFASEELFNKVTESLLGLQNAMGSGLGSVYVEGISRAGSAIGGLGRGIGGRLTR